MAFPQVETSATHDGSGNTTTATMNYPASIASGDLLIVLAGCDGISVSMTPPSGFTEIYDNARSFAVFAKEADGTETGTTTYTQSANEWPSNVVYRISGWDDSGSLSDAIEVAVGTLDAASPDPPSLTASWGSDDNLWIAAKVAHHGSGFATAYPYTDNQEFAGLTGGGSGSNVDACTDEIATATANPGTFTLNGQVGDPYTIVIKPASEGGGGGISIPVVARGYRNMRV